MYRQVVLAVCVLGGIAAAQSVANNTSACTGNNAPTAGCNGVGVMPMTYNVADVGAQTTTINPLPTNVSTQSVKGLLYSGATTRTVAAYLPWFCNTSSPTCNGHKNIGMQESNSAQVLAQAQWMKTIGFDSVSVDYYGCGADCGETSAKAYHLSVTKALANAIATNPTTTPTFMLRLDSGAINGSGTGQCAPSAGDQSACLIAAINTQLDYMAATWLYQSYYETNAANGHPIVMFFIDQGSWPDTNFNTVYAAVKAHATQGQSCGTGCTYTTTVDFLDENSGAFTESGIDGGFAWPHPAAWSSTNQFCWAGSCPAGTYLSNFYSVARSHSSKIAMGTVFKGFDDNNASFGSNRVIAQQCGQVLNLSANAISTAGYSSSSQLQYVIFTSWNDYEEGTEVETGVDNCFTIAQPTISGGTLSWSLVKSDSTYASTSTISGISIYTGPGSPTTLFASGISPTVTTHAAPPVGLYVWVYAVGGPLIQNQLSPAVPNVQPAPPAAMFASGRVVVTGSGRVQ